MVHTTNVLDGRDLFAKGLTDEESDELSTLTARLERQAPGQSRALAAAIAAEWACRSNRMRTRTVSRFTNANGDVPVALFTVEGREVPVPIEWCVRRLLTILRDRSTEEMKRAVVARRLLTMLRDVSAGRRRWLKAGSGRLDETGGA